MLDSMRLLSFIGVLSMNYKEMKYWRDKPQESQASQVPQDIDTLKSEIRKLVDENGFHD